MSSEWKEIALGDFLTLKRGYDLPKSKRKNGHIPIISSSGFSGIHNVSMVNGPGVVTGRYGTIGEVFYVDGEYWPLNTTLYVEDFKDNSPLFAYYLLQTINFYTYSDKAAVPGINRNHIHMARVRVPTSRYVQDEIALILKKIDDKIIKNKNINQLFEQIAQALFKSWFVDFEPVKAKIAVLEAGGSQEEATLAAMTAISGKNADSLAVFEREQPEKYAEFKTTAELFPSAMQESKLGKIPEGWDVDNLGKLVEFNPKRTLKKGISASYLDMKNVPVKGHSVNEVIFREFTSGTKFKNGDTLLARITPCLENGKTAYVDFLPSENTVGWGSTEFIVMRVKRELPLSLSYFIARLESFRTMAIQSMQGTSGRQRADAAVLQNMSWIMPPDALLVKFGTFGDFVIDSNRSRHSQNTQLSQLRDTLLPKLLSGEITLPEAEASVKDAEHV